MSENSPRPTVYIGIVTYNSFDDLPHCFTGIRQQTYPAISIVVLDNASKDGSLEWVKLNAPDAFLIPNKDNEGFAKGHNRILQQCHLKDEDYYLALNPDVVMSPNYITNLVATMREHQAGWGTGKLLLNRENNPSDLIYSIGHAMYRDGYTANIGYLLPNNSQYDISQEVFGAPGAAVLIHQQLIASITSNGELFDSDMFMYGEDTDLDWRARNQGWHCWYAADAVAYHRGSHAGSKMKAHALSNRYLGVIKNAYWMDLLWYNLPRIFAHCAIRLILTPHSGVYIIYRLVRFGPRMLYKRRKPTVSRQASLDWFRWSRKQPTGQPTTIFGRLKAAKCTK